MLGAEKLTGWWRLATTGAEFEAHTGRLPVQRKRANLFSK